LSIRYTNYVSLSVQISAEALFIELPKKIEEKLVSTLTRFVCNETFIYLFIYFFYSCYNTM